MRELWLDGVAVLRVRYLSDSDPRLQFKFLCFNELQKTEKASASKIVTEPLLKENSGITRQSLEMTGFAACLGVAVSAKPRRLKTSKAKSSCDATEELCGVRRQDV